MHAPFANPVSHLAILILVTSVFVCILCVCECYFMKIKCECRFFECNLFVRIFPFVHCKELNQIVDSIFWVCMVSLCLSHTKRNTLLWCCVNVFVVCCNVGSVFLFLFFFYFCSFVLCLLLCPVCVCQLRCPLTVHENSCIYQLAMPGLFSVIKYI